MRLVLISDTHSYHNEVKLPEGDVLIHCGDSTVYGEISEMKKFLIWFSDRDFHKKIFINGNHEVKVSQLGNLTRFLVQEVCDGTVKYLENEACKYNGLKFYGSPYTPEFFPEHWAYQLFPDKAKHMWSSIPEDTDVLITHGPPAGILDGVRTSARYPHPNAGCKHLLERIKELNIKLNCFGHLHANYGWIRPPANSLLSRTLFVNASICTESYKPSNKPFVVDTETWSCL